MGKAIYIGVTAILSLMSGFIASAEQSEVVSYGAYKEMIQQRKSEGVIELQTAIPVTDSYAVGAIEHGRGEITVLDGRIYLDYGIDGMGQSAHTIPQSEQAVLLAVSQVEQWQSVTIEGAMNQEDLYMEILGLAMDADFDVDKPFPFLLEGNFDQLQIHVINERNPAFTGHGGREKFYHQHRELRTNQRATVVGFYSALQQGIYTHPGESWHLHAVIEGEKIGAHVDRIVSGSNIRLKLPVR
ncbi:MAG: hypothetical protein HOL04_11520 [Gammaproteobacteria bacterium]|nr:hypothetical protein [Gammaproteobacteria bacterium]MBT4607025.1 hypothetical protein [Thiotrichales bacterium]MBT4080267.1 hypothetical protein [Gammaproteobacteria bacterium]MBT4331465.1 hypothetical protein [Gammaproteobacteria bacterium]MBT5362362.1 hypothetical protein [Gammaproteobacteria bacterium]